MEVFQEYLAHIEDLNHRAKTEEVLSWVIKKFPQLVPKIAWNQPMFTNNGTFIIGFSVAKHHLAIAPESVGINQFSDEFKQAGYVYSNQLVRFKWESPFDFTLLEKMINFNISDKADCTTFWRK